MSHVFSAIWKRLRRLRGNEGGASAAEYVLIIAVVAIGIIAGLNAFKEKANTKLTNLGDQIGSTTGEGGGSP